MSQNNTKKGQGEYYTTTNPFNHELFFEWFEKAKETNFNVLLEPFAGANNIVSMLKDIGVDYHWHCFDINGDSPRKEQLNQSPEFFIHQQDTLKNFPQGYDVCVTNPPYLAKNSASRSKIPFPETHFDDLYKLSLQKMLDNVDYIAAIIPESFLTANDKSLKSRLYGIISLTRRMFNDTDHPVCLALFTSKKHLPEQGYKIYSGDKFIGFYNQMKEKEINIKQKINNHITFNQPDGELGLRAVDGTQGPSIEFIKGDEIEPEKIKVSSRSLTRIHIEGDAYDIDNLINRCNQIIKKIRNESDDIFMTSFKGLRKDNRYRRRLDFKTAKKIITKALIEQKQGDL